MSVICEDMNTKKTYLLISFIIVLGISWIFIDSKNVVENNSENIKVALREVGHRMLLVDKDSTSLVLPIKELENLEYKLTFEKNLAIIPDSLVKIVRESFGKSNLPEYYLVEVTQCIDNEVAYSYKVQNEKEKNIIPCMGRFLPNGCYEIKAQFINGGNFSLLNRFIAIAIGLLIVSLLWGLFKTKPKPNNVDIEHEDGISIGNYLFYPNQNRLILQQEEVLLSKKEGELLAILASNLNRVIKREDLAKKVWEDNGVVVGRSLDTYISKLRKRLQKDESIKLTNVHGVGYKLIYDSSSGSKPTS